MHSQMKTPYIKEPRKQPGSLIPLFERLIDFEGNHDFEKPIHKFYDKRSVKDSIQRELFHLLGTHVKLSQEDYLALLENDDNYALPAMYGIADFSYFEGIIPQNWKIFARYLEKVITAFDPRLSAPTVQIKDFNLQQQTLDVMITATILDSQFQEEATFELHIKKKAA